MEQPVETWTVRVDADLGNFESEMEAQRNRGRAARKADVIVAATEGELKAEATKFVGYDINATSVTHAKIADVVP